MNVLELKQKQLRILDPNRKVPNIEGAVIKFLKSGECVSPSIMAQRLGLKRSGTALACRRLEKKELVVAVNVTGFGARPIYVWKALFENKWEKT